MNAKQKSEFAARMQAAKAAKKAAKVETVEKPQGFKIRGRKWA